jgi:manganese-dependent inorganic pyrophosphatase
VDIIKKTSNAFTVSDKEENLIKDVFRGKTMGDEIYLEGIVSRKKQIVPPLTEKLTK